MNDVPSSLLPSFRPPARAGFRGLGAVSDAKQAQLLIDFDRLVASPLAGAASKLSDVAKYNPSAYSGFAAEMASLFDAQAALEQKINQLSLPVSEAVSQSVGAEIDTLAARAETFRLHVTDASRAGVEQSQLRTALISVTVGAAAVAFGWWYLRRSGKKRRR
jgi:hypothetical protein